MKEVSVILLMAGSSSRMNVEVNKVYLPLGNKKVFNHSLDKFLKVSSINKIIIVYNQNDLNSLKKELENYEGYNIFLTEGGKTRNESVLNGLKLVDTEFVLIHDAARCLVTPMEINCVAEAVYKYGAATASLPMIDTVKKCTDEHIIMGTLDRRNLRTVQTPQGFSKAIYKKALDAHSVLSPEITDDNMLLEKIGVSSFCVDTLSTNIKITAPSDIELAEFIITKRNKVG